MNAKAGLPLVLEELQTTVDIINFYSLHLVFCPATPSAIPEPKEIFMVVALRLLLESDQD